MVTVIMVAAAIAGVLIQVASSPDAKRPALMRGMAGLLTLSFHVLGVVSVVQRGVTHSSLAIFGAASVWSGLFLVVMVRVLPLEGTAAVVIEARQPANRRFARTLLVWCALTATGALIPLRYTGALSNDPILAVSNVVAFGKFNPPTEEHQIKVGQCLLVRQPAGTNPVVPCTVLHRSEIIDALEVSGSKNCPDIGGLPHEGLALHIVTVGPYDGVSYCVIQSESPTRPWTGRIGMPYTP